MRFFIIMLVVGATACRGPLTPTPTSASTVFLTVDDTFHRIPSVVMIDGVSHVLSNGEAQFTIPLNTELIIAARAPGFQPFATTLTVVSPNTGVTLQLVEVDR